MRAGARVRAHTYSYNNRATNRLWTTTICLTRCKSAHTFFQMFDDAKSGKRKAKNWVNHRDGQVNKWNTTMPMVYGMCAGRYYERKENNACCKTEAQTRTFLAQPNSFSKQNERGNQKRFRKKNTMRRQKPNANSNQTWNFWSLTLKDTMVRSRHRLNDRSANLSCNTLFFTRKWWGQQNGSARRERVNKWHNGSIGWRKKANTKRNCEHRS